MSYIDGALLKKALKGAAKYLDNNKEIVNSLNVFPVPDGDTGTNMSLTMQSALKQGNAEESNSVSKVALAASHGSLMGARGNSGVILSQLFRGFAVGLEEKEQADVKLIARAFKKASDTAYNAVMKPTEGTILTVARECGEKALQLIAMDGDIEILDFLKEVIKHGNEALDKTPEMLPVLKEAGVVDAGGKGLMAVLMGAYNTLSGIEEEEEPTLEEQEEKYQEVVEHKNLDLSDIEFGYCTEFMIYGEVGDLERERFRNTLASKGDSLMVVPGDNIVKVHVHTNNPGEVLQEALKLGVLNDIKIDNMRIQYEKVKEKEEIVEDIEKEMKKYSFIAISAGEGIGEIFKGLNVDLLVEGGQTMNPSTEDISEAINKVSGENIFILPNNSNIILAAEQAKQLTDKNVIIIPTKTVPEGIAALFEFDESQSVEENEEVMLSAIKEVKTGEVTYSVRDTEIKGKKINKDDIIGISDSEIKANGKEMSTVAQELLVSMVDEDSSLITIIYGEDVEEDEANILEEFISEKYEDLDVELVYGGQPIYYYIFSVE